MRFRLGCVREVSDCQVTVASHSHGVGMRLYLSARLTSLTASRTQSPRSIRTWVR
jgi:hypothetical protein